MKNSKKILGFIAFAAIILFSYPACNQSIDHQMGSTEISINRYVAEPSPFTGNDKIIYSYSYEGYDFYYIHLGQLKNIPMFYFNAEHFGTTAEYIYEFETTTTETSTMRNIITNTSQESLRTIDQHSKSLSVGGKLSTEISEKFNMKTSTEAKIAGIGSSVDTGFELGIKVAAETNWSQNSGLIETVENQKSISLTDTREHVLTYTETNRFKRTWPLSKTKGDREGWYRYTLFSASDVFLYVIKDESGVIYYEFCEHIKPNTFGWALDYSKDMSFEKSDSTNFEFDVSMLDNLPPAGFLTVTFDENYTAPENTEEPELQTIVVNNGTTIGTLPAPPSRAGYSFVGWNTEADGSGTAFLSNTPVTDNITVYAQWAITHIPVQKTETRAFGWSTDGIYTFDKGFPATVDIYAGGAGGGGAGGYWVEGGGVWPANLNNYYNCGGAGGGGAVEYRRIEISSATTFYVSIGSGGWPGDGRKRGYWERTTNSGWLVNEEGKDGGGTSISWNGNTLTAAGGKGGGALNGGAGGTSSHGANGDYGSNGIKDSSSVTVGPSWGGSGAYYNNFGSSGYGGNGGGTINKNPQPGGLGMAGNAMLVFTWWE